MKNSSAITGIPAFIRTFAIVYYLKRYYVKNGLVLDSPAVIIGAMLISPLMNPILSSGLALASGNLVLGVRATFNLILSCAAAKSFAFRKRRRRTATSAKRGC